MRAIILSIAMLGVTGVAHAAPSTSSDPLIGRWALKADGQIVTLLTVRPKDGKLEVERCRPDDSGITSDLEFSVDKKAAPIVCDILLQAKSPRTGTVVSFDAGMAYDSNYIKGIVLQSAGSNVVSMTITGLQIVPIALERATANDRLSQTLTASRPYRLDQHWPDNPEMKALFDADQGVRSANKPIDWKIVGAQDAERRVATQKLLDEGKLWSANDYWRAAFIFQHGDAPEDYLKAHALAVISAAKGKGSASWIAAATLDRYLQSVAQKQIYGTQFSGRDGEPMIQEPYDRTVISDALRRESGVPDMAGQEKQRAEMEARFKARVKAK